MYNILFWHTACNKKSNTFPLEVVQMKKVLSTIVAALVAISFSAVVFAADAMKPAAAPAAAPMAEKAAPAADAKKEAKPAKKKKAKKAKKEMKEMKKEEAPAAPAKM